MKSKTPKFIIQPRKNVASYWAGGYWVQEVSEAFHFDTKAEANVECRAEGFPVNWVRETK